MISTVVTGIGGGAIAVQYFRLQEWVGSLGGLIFGCGLPGWAIVRWVFNFIEKILDAGIDEVAEEARGGMLRTTSVNCAVCLMPSTRRRRRWCGCWSPGW